MLPLDKHLGKCTLGEILFGKVSKLNLARWEKALCPKIGDNEESTNKSFPVGISCMRTRTLIFGNLVLKREYKENVLTHA